MNNMTKPPRIPILHTLLLLALTLFTQRLVSPSCCCHCCHGFAFQIPRIRLPWDSTTSSSTDSASNNSNVSKKSPIVPNDKIVVFGGTGGVGQLVTRKLLARGGKAYNVCVVARDASRARTLLLPTTDDDDDDNSDNNNDNGKLEVAEMDLVGEAKASDDDLRSALLGSSAIVLAVGTTAFPTQRWKGGNTPQAIDSEAVSRIARVAADIPTMRRMVLVTSVGVQRTNEMPFLILNLFGVLDAKRSGEDAVKSYAMNSGCSYSIIRPGRLVGGPYTNLDLATLFQVEGGASNGVTVQSGDALLGDCKRDVCAEAVLQCLENRECEDVVFSMVSNEERALTEGEWSEAFREMREGGGGKQQEE